MCFSSKRLCYSLFIVSFCKMEADNELIGLVIKHINFPISITRVGCCSSLLIGIMRMLSVNIFLLSTSDEDFFTSSKETLDFIESKSVCL